MWRINIDRGNKNDPLIRRGFLLAPAAIMLCCQFLEKDTTHEQQDFIVWRRSDIRSYG